jgi:acetylornithine deacetylase/succinyl-diaminopimelate desuccinylase-like protein
MADTEKVLSLIHKDDIVNLAVELGNIYAPTGFEKNIGEFIYGWLNKNGFQTIKQEAAPNRNNVIATLKGTGEGRSLILNSHMDTDIGAPEDYWTVGELKPVYNHAWVEGDSIIGRSVVNDRGPMTATMIAAKAIKDSGTKLKGDLVLTVVVGEIGKAPVDEFQGPEYLGKGLGTNQLVNHGVLADYALVAERTAFTLTWTEAGAAYFKITVKGQGGIYTPYIKRPSPIEQNPNAIVKMTKIIQALEEWAYDYERKNTCEFAGVTVIPKVNIGAIRGGLPYKPSKSVGICSIYVDVRLPPGKEPLEVRRELRSLIAKTGIDAEIEMYLFRMGHEGKNVTRLVESIEKAHQTIFKKKPEKIDAGTTSMWRDCNVFNGVGIPSVSYGPAATKFYEGVAIEDLVNTSKLYAMIAMDMCNQ